MPLLFQRSSKKLRIPCTKLVPPVSNARLSAAGLPISTLVGESASVRSRIAKRCCSVSFHSPSPLPLSGTIDIMVERQTR